MKTAFLLVLTLLFATISCRKEKIGHPDPPSTGVALLKLKDVTVNNLPSPYYHFEYNDTGNITLAEFSAGIKSYQVTYAGKDIASMLNTADPGNNVKLDYVYNNGDLIAVVVKSMNGDVLRHCIISYSPGQQLQEIDWDLRDGNIGFYLEQSMKFSYYPDGNLMQMVTHNYPVGAQTEATYTDRFENYDDHVNVDAFSLLHTSPHDLILLPGLKLQLNNPRRVIHTGDGVNFDINYTYSYDAMKRPTSKTGDVTVTNGSAAGQHYESRTAFSYYN